MWRKQFFSDNFSLQKLVNYIATHLPLPFLVRKDEAGQDLYIRTGNKTFGQLLAVRPAELGDLTPTDVNAMLGFSFLPVKPKRHGIIELRSPDGSYPLRLAQGAFPLGILYDAEALDAADHILKSFNGKDYVELAADVMRSGLNATLPQKENFRAVTQKLLALAHDGLTRRGMGEEVYLQPFLAIAHGEEPTPEQKIIARTKKGQRDSLSLREAIRSAFLETAIPVAKPTEVSADASYENGQKTSILAHS